MEQKEELRFARGAWLLRYEDFNSPTSLPWNTREEARGTRDRMEAPRLARMGERIPAAAPYLLRDEDFDPFR
jgi:hypothetical protein